MAWAHAALHLSYHGRSAVQILDIRVGSRYAELAMAFRTSRSTIQFGMGGGTTPVVKKLLIANIAVFVAATLLGVVGLGKIIGPLMLMPYAVTHQFALWQLGTYLFLHGGIWHIMFNMLALWMFGCDLERDWGSRRFLTYYFVTGIGAGVCIVLASFNSRVPTVGASGAIYGILLAFGMTYPNRMIHLILPPVAIAAKYMVMIWGGIAFLSSLSNPGGPVSHIAHLGGMIFGFIYLRVRGRWFDWRNTYYRWKRQRLQRKFQVYQSKRDREEGRGNPDRWVN